jgi:hypothetical protein
MYVVGVQYLKLFGSVVGAIFSWLRVHWFWLLSFALLLTIVHSFKPVAYSNNLFVPKCKLHGIHNAATWNPKCEGPIWHYTPSPPIEMVSQTLPKEKST